MEVHRGAASGSHSILASINPAWQFISIPARRSPHPSERVVLTGSIKQGFQLRKTGSQDGYREQIQIAHSRERLAKADLRFEPARELISFNSRAASCFESGDLTKKRLILETVGSNLLLKDGKLSIEAKKLFRRWSKTASISDMRAYVKEVRTFFVSQDPEIFEMITKISLLPQFAEKRRAA